MNKLNIFSTTLLFIFLSSYQSMGQSFTNSQALLGSGFNSGGCVGVVDMDGDGLDDVMILDNSTTLSVAYQETDGSFSIFPYGAVSGSQQWGSCVADINNDGHKDVLSGGGYDGVHVEYITSRGVSTSASLNNGSMFMQACNLADIDNDGWLDAFACHDDALSRTWKNDGTGSLSFDGTMMDLLAYDYSAFPGTDHSGNYGTVWSDFDDDGDLDLYIAKCRQGVNTATDPRRVNQLWVNDGNGNYTEEAASRGLQIFQQSWTADFADVDNDGDLDCFITNHTSTLKLLQNDGTGHFTDVSVSAGIAISGFFLQAKLEDLDNDGYVDILYSGGAAGYYHNDGDGTFTSMTNPFPYTDGMHSFSIGDLNNDGALDVYASYGNTYVSPDLNHDDVLWLNDGNSNNWVSFDLTGIFSNLDAIGAKVKIYGSWGTQVREVRSGESYGITNSSKCHFGIGAANSIDSAEIIWPSGTVTNISAPSINTVHSVTEAACVLSNVTIDTSNGTGFCAGTTVTISAPAGYSSYLWSNAADTQDINVSEAGFYSVTVFDTEGCVGISAQVEVTEVVPAPPSLTLDGEPTFCQGSSLNISVNEGASYEWSNGAVSQSIDVTESGLYSVTMTDICSNVNVSSEVEVTVLATAMPDVADEAIATPQAVTLSGTSPNLVWYDDENAVTEIATGSSYTTPVISATTTYWVENTASYGGAYGIGGESSQGDGAYHTNSANWLLFDAYEDFTLKSVKVFANGTGNRTIQIIDDNGTTVHEGTYAISDGEFTVQLNWEIAAGTNYGMRTTDGNPSLWRDAPPSALNYPYDLAGLGAITSSSITGANQFVYYYFFYDWEVEIPSIDCVTGRVPVTITFDDGTAGCTNPSACNYDPFASSDDGSCSFDCNDCAGDINGNGVVATDDLNILLAMLGCSAPTDCGPADLNGDGNVNVGDLNALLSVYASVCP